MQNALGEKTAISPARAPAREREERGLPYKFTPAVQQSLMTAAKLGVPDSRAAVAAGITAETLKEWATHEHPEVAEFMTVYKAAQGGAHVGMHASILQAGQPDEEGRRGDWRATAYLLERVTPEYRVDGHAGLGPKPQDAGPALTEKQVEHRIVRMIANPTRKMQELLVEALKRGNETLQRIVTEHVRSLPVDTAGETVIEPPDGSVVNEDGTIERPETMTTELQERLGKFVELLTQHDRVALGGGPGTGKTTVFAAVVNDRPVVHTDDFMPTDPAEARKTWKDIPLAVKAECEKHERFVVEGVRVTGAVRQGLEVDCLVFLIGPLKQLTPGQKNMSAGRLTDLHKLQSEQPLLKVVIL